MTVLMKTSIGKFGFYALLLHAHPHTHSLRVIVFWNSLIQETKGKGSEPMAQEWPLVLSQNHLHLDIEPLSLDL